MNIYYRNILTGVVKSYREWVKEIGYANVQKLLVNNFMEVVPS